MIGALSVADIERDVRERNKGGSAVLIFSSYNGERSGRNYDFLSKATDYHFHSGKKTDLYCVGYSFYESKPNAKSGRNIKIPKEIGWPLTSFYPEIFHEVRLVIQGQLRREWSYEGGVDILLFPSGGSKSDSIEWSRAAVVRSRQHVGSAFQDEDHMIRTIINLSEHYEGNLIPDQLEPEVRRASLVAKLKKFAGEAAGSVLASAITLIGS